MLFSTFLFIFISCFFDVSLGRGLFESTTSTSLTHRSTIGKRAILAGYICEKLAIEVPLAVPDICVQTGILAPVCTPQIPLTIRISDGVCLCLSAGALTPQSLLNLNATIYGNGPILSQLTTSQQGTPAYTVTSLLNTIANTVRPILNTDSAKGTCPYPAGSTPNSCTGDCGYTCPAGQCASRDASSCVLCPSGIPVSRRDYSRSPVDFRCQKGFSACAVDQTKPKSIFDSNTYECIDTQNDIESCGGCLFDNGLGRKSNTPGQDCTAIPFAGSVGCRFGTCVVRSCEKGYEVDATGEGCVKRERNGSVAGHGQVSFGREVKWGKRV